MNTSNFNSNKMILTVANDSNEQSPVIYNFTSKEGTILKTYLDKLLVVLESLFSDSCEYEFSLKHIKSESVEFSVNFCGEDEIKELNKEYRGKDSVTDVLSFSLHGDLRSVGSVFVEESSPVLHLGDIFICKEVATNQAKKASICLSVELLELIIHGFLHLCGLDHERSKDEEKIMYKLEKEIFDRVTQEDSI